MQHLQLLLRWGEVGGKGPEHWLWDGGGGTWGGGLEARGSFIYLLLMLSSLDEENPPIVKMPDCFAFLALEMLGQSHQGNVLRCWGVVVCLPAEVQTRTGETCSFPSPKFSCPAAPQTATV